MKKIYAFLLLAGLFLLGAQNVKAVDHLYEIGDNQGAWNPENGIEMTKVSENVFTGTFTFTKETSYFAFTTVQGSWSEVNANRYGGATNGQLVADGDVASLATGERTLTIGPGKFTITVNLSALTATIAEVPDPIVSLTSSEPLAYSGVTTTLTATSNHFDAGEISYSYSYSIDGGTSFSAIAGSGASTSFVFGDADSYVFKVVATLNAQVAENTITVQKLTSLTVAGTENFFGTNWNTGDENNDMDVSAGVFTWTKTQYYVASSMNISFKVVANHTWDVSFPASNVDKTLNVGYHNVTISFNWSTKELTFEDVTYPKVAVRGQFTGWTARYMDYNPSTGSLSTNIAINTPDLYNGERGFKLQLNDDGENEVGFMNTITRTDCTDWLLNDKNHNCGLKADVPGYYTFTYYYNEVAGAWKLNVTYPTSFTREATTTNYQTLCVPFDAAITNAEVYDVTAVDANSVTIAAIDAALLSAGHSYIIKPETAANMVITKNGDNIVDSPVNTYLYGILGADYNPTAALNAYVLSGNLFHLVAEDDAATVNSTRAYLKAVDASAAPAIRIIMEGNEATSINNIEAVDEAVKFIQNGQLFIKKNGVVYNAVGAVVK